MNKDSGLNNQTRIIDKHAIIKKRIKSTRHPEKEVKPNFFLSKLLSINNKNRQIRKTINKGINL